MKRAFTIAIVLCCAMACIDALAASPHASNHLRSTRIQTSAIKESSRVHSAGDVLFMTGNYGVFGGRGVLSGIELLIYSHTPKFEYPKGSRREHCFNAGLWLSGIIGVDTGAVTAVDALSQETYGAFVPLTGIASEFDTIRGRETFSCRYLTSNWGRSPEEQLADLLRMEVRQTSHVFASRPYDRFAIVEFVVRNASKDTIKRPHVGIYADFDVGNSVQSWPGYEDDVSGFLRSHCLAYSIDNNGDPSAGGMWAFGSSLSAAGIAPICCDPPAIDTSFNWWGTGGNQDWGPSRAEDQYASWALPNWYGEYYELMSNGEFDYDQLWSAIDMRSEGWSRPPAGQSAVNIANGLDTRVLLSFGFRDLAPNDSIRLVIAFVAGDSVHVDPSDFADHFDPDHPDAYYSRLNFTDLIKSVEKARYAWFNRFELDGAAPAIVEVQSLGDNVVQCTWPAAPFLHVTGYRVHRRIQGSNSWEIVGQTEPEVRNWIDTVLAPDSAYEYAVSSLDWSRAEGPRCRPTSITLGIPPFAPTLTGETTPQLVGLNWVLYPLDSVFSQYRYLNLYRRSSPWSNPELIAHLPIRPDGQGRPLIGKSRERVMLNSFDFVDDDVSIGTTYFYSASAVNELGGEGPKSAEISVTPMGLDKRGVVIFHTRYGSDILVNRDSLVSFYTTWAREYAFDTMSLEFVQPIGFDSQALSHYSCVVLVIEDQRGRLTYSNFTRWLLTATNAGLKLVLILRNHGQGDVGVPYWDQPRSLIDPFFTELLGVRSIITEGFYYYRLDSSAIVSRFIGATPTDEGYSALEADSLAGMSHGLIDTYLRFVDTTFLAGYVPAIGAFYDLDPGTKVLYRYNSAYDTSIYEGKPVAVKRITDSTAAVYFGFPLSQMKHDQAWQALTQAVADLGIDTVNYWPPPTSTTRGIIEWLYGRASGTPDSRWDVNSDGVIDIRDVVEELDR